MLQAGPAWHFCQVGETFWQQLLSFSPKQQLALVLLILILKKTLLSHFRLALHYYERTPLPPQFLSCVNTETHCIQISLFSAPSLDGLGVVSVLDFVLWSQQEAGEWEQVAEQRTDCACHSLCWGESHQSFLTWNHSNVGLGEIWFRLSLFTTADFCVVLKTPVQKFHSFLLGSLV